MTTTLGSQIDVGLGSTTQPNIYIQSWTPLVSIHCYEQVVSKIFDAIW